MRFRSDQGQLSGLPSLSPVLQGRAGGQVTLQEGLKHTHTHKNTGTHTHTQTRGMNCSCISQGLPGLRGEKGDLGERGEKVDVDALHQGMTLSNP